MKSPAILSAINRVVGTTLLIWLVTALSCIVSAQEPKNILFISIDDLRPELGIYGSRAHTPNIDALAANGLTFERAYCQSPMCNPSRASLLSGLRPDTVRVWDLCKGIRAETPDLITLPQHFKLEGYFTRGLGKVFSQNLNDSRSWSVPHIPANIDFGQGPSWQAVSSQRALTLPDTLIASAAIKALQTIGEQGNKFFLAVGFLRPHLPFVAPQEYYDLYPKDSIELPHNFSAPANVPSLALHEERELISYSDISSPKLSEQKAKELIRGYLAAVSFVDAQVGRLLGELDALGLRDDTIVILWGDHGFHLGQNSLWTKWSNFDIAARVPLILSVPGHKSAGKKTDALVELVDLYPTLCELTGLPIPNGLEGRSLVPLLDDPERPWKTAVFYQFFRPLQPFCFSGQKPITGYSIKTDRHRYTEWIRQSTDAVIAVELYDHKTDPGETVNIAGNTENEALLSELSERLSAGWKGELDSVPEPPRAEFVLTPEKVKAMQPFQVDGSSSTTEVGHSIVSWEWDFGDGAAGKGRVGSHTYFDVDDFVIRLTVRDSRGIAATTNVRVQIECPSGDAVFQFVPLTISNQQAELVIFGSSGQQIRVQRSENLAGWEDWRTVSIASDQCRLRLTDDVTTASGRFYRAIVEDPVLME